MAFTRGTLTLEGEDMPKLAWVHSVANEKRYAEASLAQTFSHSLAELMTTYGLSAVQACWDFCPPAEGVQDPAPQTDDQALEKSREPPVPCGEASPLAEHAGDEMDFLSQE